MSKRNFATSGIHHTSFRDITKCDVDIRVKLATLLNLRHSAQIDCGKFRQREDLCTPRRKHHHFRRRAFPLRGSVGLGKFHLAKKPAASMRFSFQSTMNCDLDTLEDSCANVGLLGGTTMFQGIDERMTVEFVAPAPCAMNSRSKECAEFPGVSLYHAEHVGPGSKPL